MTLANQRKLLEHFKRTNQDARVKVLEEHIRLKILKIKANMNNPNLPNYHIYQKDPEFMVKPVEAKPEVKTSGKKSKG